MTALTFPTNPTVGQIYNAPNGIIYIYDGVKWSVENIASSSQAVTNSTQDRVAPMFVDGDNQGITFTYNPTTNTMSATVTSTVGDTLVNGEHEFALEANGTVTLDGAPFGSSTLNDLTDVSASEPNVNEKLGWNGSAWVPQTTDRLENGNGILSINGSFIQIMPPGSQNIIIQPGNIYSPITLRGKFLTVVEYNSTWDPAEDPPLAAGLNTNSTISLNQNGISFSNTRAGTASDFEQNWMFGNDGTLTIPGTISSTSIGGTAIESVTVTDTTGLYLNSDKTGNSGSAFVYATNNVVLRADNNGVNKNWTFDADGSLTLPNSTTISNDLAGTYSSTFLCMPWGVNDQTSGLFSSNSITRPLFASAIAEVTIGWFVSGPGLNGVKEIIDIVEMGEGDRAFIVDLTDESLWADLSVNIPYRFYTPDYALVYNGTRLTVDSNEWNFTQAGDLTIPGNINEKAGNDLEIAVHNNRNNDGTPGSAVLSLTNNDAVDYSTYTTLDVGAYSIKLNTDYTGVFTGARRTWEFKRDGTLTLPTGGTLGFEGMGWPGFSNGTSQLPVSVMYKDDTGYPQSAITFSGGNNVDGEGNVIIDTYNASTETGQQWTFGATGTLTLPNYMTRDTEYGGGPRLVIDANANMAEIRSNSNILIGYNDSLGNVFIGNPNGGGQVDIVGSRFRVLVDVPASSIGSVGDQAGQIAVDSSYIYYCTQNFGGTTYNVVHMLAQGFDANGVDNGYLVADSYQLPQVGWKVYYNGETRTIDQVNSSNPGFYIVFVDSPLTIPGQAAFAWGPTPATNIWKRVAWSGDTW